MTNKITTPESMNEWLQENYIGVFDPKLDLVDKWSMETENGSDYLKKYGPRVLARILHEFRHGDVKTCKVAHRDMRSDVIGTPLGNMFQNKILDMCCKKNGAVTPDMVDLAFCQRVLTEHAMDLMYPEFHLNVQTENKQMEAIPSADLNDTVQTSNELIETPDMSKKGGKRRRKS